MRGMRVLMVALLFLVPLVAQADHAVNINTADKATLMTLTGIGEVKAQAIIDYRATNTFDTTEEIKEVSGIGDATYNNIKDHITVGSSAATSQSTETTSSQSSSTTTSTSSSSASAPVSSYVAPPEPSVYVDAGKDRTVIVAADTEFVARAYNKQQELVSNARFHWNFGDGAAAEGQKVLHHYSYPGKYAVILSVSRDMESISDRIVVTAEPALLGFLVGSDGSVTIENRAGHDLDLSRWTVRAFLRDFVLPENSIVLAGSSMRISPKTMGFFATGEAKLAYPNGAVAFEANQGSAAQPERFPAAAPAPLPKTATYKPPSDRQEDTAEPIADELVVEKATSTMYAAASAASGTSYWWLGALALAGATGASVIAIRRKRSGEWDIIEESGRAV